MSANPSDDIVRLATAPNPAQAHLWEQALRQAGVQCKVVGDYLDAGIGDIPGLRAELWVHKNDVARAEEVLNELQQADASARDEEE
jgi:hypothetical protein